MLAAVFIVLALALSSIMVFAWIIAGRSGSCGWIDAIWSYAVGACGVVVSLLPLGASSHSDERQWLVAGLAALWSIRLGSHIAARTLRGGDDPRYKQLQQNWGNTFRSRLFWFLQIQAIAAFLLVVTILIAAHRPGAGLSYGDVIGIVIFAAAIIGEALADRQLARFSADSGNKGKVCETGLWAYSRHPNYFFEWLIWVAFAAIAIDWSGSYLFGWFALAGPVFMYWLLVHVSGIPPLEAHMLRSRGDRFRDYQQRVNAFWPGPAIAVLSGNRSQGGTP